MYHFKRTACYCNRQVLFNVMMNCCFPPQTQALMRLDHIAFRVADRHKTAEFFMKCFGYKLPHDLPDGFDITFEDQSSAQCYVLEPPEKLSANVPWAMHLPQGDEATSQAYHMPPEIFISDGSEGSIVREWVKARGGVGGIHHLAFQVDSVENTMQEWTQKGYAEFSSPEPLRCPGLTQVFTKPSLLTGVIFEFIERETHGFCKDNVKDLMQSTRDFR